MEDETAQSQISLSDERKNMDVLIVIMGIQAKPFLDFGTWRV